MCQDDVAELPSWTEGARRMHEVGSEMDADSQVWPSQGVRGKSGNPNVPNILVASARVAWETYSIERELAGKQLWVSTSHNKELSGHKSFLKTQYAFLRWMPRKDGQGLPC